ncbi:MAG TPA: GAF domain-containing protein [Terriglobales bacterium]|nr:GAF domain-containing protein [Terriglobales bacterium]
MSVRLPVSQLHFFSLPTAIFCVQCELISANTTPACLACGSKAVLSLSRLLGGSLRSQPLARVIHDDELNRIVRDLLFTIPGAEITASLVADQAELRSERGPFSDHRDAYPNNFSVPKFELEPAIGVITERAQALTGATGAAIALRTGDEIVCRARAGRTAPDVGIRLQTDSGISAECLRSGEVVLCNEAEDDPQVDLASCRRLGVRSILAAPLRKPHKTVGIFEVLSASPNAFHDQHVTTMQLLASMMVAAISRISHLGESPRQC